MNKLHLISLGCVKNLVDSEVMLAKLKDYELTMNIEEADVIIINTCGFIESAKTESIETILEAAQYKKENALLVVSGCLSERYKDELQKELKEEVDIFTGVGDYNRIDELIKNRQSKFSEKTFLIKNEERVITGSNYHAYIKLSEGCNQKCSFCAIPSFKGKLQSREINDVIQEIKYLKKQGYKDFSLASQDTSSYLRDKGVKDGLIKLIDEIDKIDNISVRILYLYPTTTTKKLIRRIFESNTIENYFDMPIQHISNNMLKIMRRGSNKNRIKELLYTMKEKESFIRTSVIVGHPGETEEDFYELVEFLKEFVFDRVNIFEYSDEENTYAYKLKNKIDKETINKRLEIIQKVVENTTKKAQEKFLNKTLESYFEGVSEDELFYIARPKIFEREIDGDILINESEIKSPKIGELYKVKITELANTQLIGKIIK